MKIAVCHYSFHRTWATEAWDALRFATEAQNAGASAVDFHAGLLGSTNRAAEVIGAALDKTGLELAAMALSNNFGHDQVSQVRQQIESVIAWLQIAKEIGATVVRIFGSPLPSGLIVHARDHNADRESKKELKNRITSALKEVTREAEALGLVLALENHYGWPASGEEQAELIEEIDSDCFRATVDIGNYMCVGQTSEAGTTHVAPHAAYVHVKDFAKVADESVVSGWRLEPCAVGAGDVNHAACLQILRSAGFDGNVAVEYEGNVDERVGVRESLAFLNQCLKRSSERAYP